MEGQMERKSPRDDDCKGYDVAAGILYGTWPIRACFAKDDDEDSWTQKMKKKLAPWWWTLARFNGWR